MKNKKLKPLKEKLKRAGHDLVFVEVGGIFCMIIDYDQRKVFNKEGEFTTTEFLAEASNSLGIPILKHYEG